MTEPGIHIEDVYLNRELSWLEFNSRVLEEAADDSNPLLERLRFLGITASNLDEFFMVRVASLRQQLTAGAAVPDPSGLTPEEQLQRIRRSVEVMLRRQYTLLSEDILPGLRRAGIIIRQARRLSRRRREELRAFFDEEVFPVLTPLAPAEDRAAAPRLRSGCLGIVLEFFHPDTNRYRVGLVEAPPSLDYFVPLSGAPRRDGRREFVTLDDLIRCHLQVLFYGRRIRRTAVFRILRDTDLAVDEEGVADLLRSLRDELRRRPARGVVRLDVTEGAPRELVDWLKDKFAVPDDAVFFVPGPLDLARFASLVDVARRPDLMFPSWTPAPASPFHPEEPVIETVRREHAIALFHPFQSFDPVVRVLEEAAEDPDVLAIKQTLYRVSGSSPVVRALERAAENGKQVTVVVEVKARMDEEKNLRWAEELENAGAHVIYGIAGLKVHCKALLIVRREAGGIVRYVHLSTGNYNDRTARLYTDIGMFTNDPDICMDVAALFNVMTGSSVPLPWRVVHVAPFDLRRTFTALIAREREYTRSGRARITAKMNALVDPEMVRELCEAAEAGVQVDLIVRGPCCIRPEALPENMRVVSIVGRFLEHSRIYRFENGGSPEYYLASADLMPRNLDRRIELMFPVYDDRIRSTLDLLLEWQLEDTWKGRFLTGDGYIRPRRRLRRSDSQQRACEYFRKLWEDFEESLRPGRQGGRLPVLRKPPEPRKSGMRYTAP